MRSLCSIGLVAAAHAAISQQPLPVSRIEIQPPPATSVLAGDVRDSLGHPIAYANVFVDGGGATTANESGRFRLADVPTGTTRFIVRRMGYGQLRFSMQMPADSTVVVTIHLHQVVPRLREVTVEEKMLSMSLFKAGFYDRQKSGVGYFLLPVDIRDIAPRHIEDLLVGIPGVSVLNTDGKAVAYGLSPSGYCRMSVVLDGHRYQLKGQNELLIDPRDVKALEVYARPTEVPGEFHDPDNPLCGVIVLWTKVD
ncbi:MAG TPA: carboxypeptidase regulatory-like domain-containing protein [Gemmatimonadaceae bacterium]|nr:carboxypeptidase regulatory-like domain-containing protein [Gemmatimonadaceae bacterium]